TLMPVLASLGLSRRMKDKETLLDKLAHWIYRPVLRSALRFPILTVLVVAGITVATTVLGLRLGSEFIPRLNAQAVVIKTIRHPSISLDESVRYGTMIEKALLKAFPDEIEYIWTRTGTPELATDPMGMEQSDVFITLTPRSRWKKAKTQDELTA